MKKIILNSIFLFMCLGMADAQKANTQLLKIDSVKYIPDSVPSISIEDINSVLSLIQKEGDKFTLKEYQSINQAYQWLVNVSIQRRKSKK